MEIVAAVWKQDNELRHIPLFVLCEVQLYYVRLVATANIIMAIWGRRTMKGWRLTVRYHTSLIWRVGSLSLGTATLQSVLVVSSMYGEATVESLLLQPKHLRVLTYLPCRGNSGHKSYMAPICPTDCTVLPPRVTARRPTVAEERLVSTPTLPTIIHCTRSRPPNTCARRYNLPRLAPAPIRHRRNHQAVVWYSSTINCYFMEGGLV